VRTFFRQKVGGQFAILCGRPLWMAPDAIACDLSFTISFDRHACPSNFFYAMERL